MHSFLWFLRDEGGMLSIGLSLTGAAANANLSPAATTQVELLSRDGLLILSRSGATILAPTDART